jgi:hypothetical protein
MFFVVLAAAIVLNKRILSWWKSVAILLAITVIVAGATYERWYPELSGAIVGVLNLSEAESAVDNGLGELQIESPGDSEAEAADEATAAGTTGEATAANAGEPATPAAAPPAKKPVIDYFINDGDDIIVSLDGNEATITVNKDDPFDTAVKDADGKALEVMQTLLPFGGNADGEPSPTMVIEDPRFAALTLVPASVENEVTGETMYYCMIGIAGESQVWPFALTDEGTFYHNDIGKRVKLRNVPHVGWSDNPGFGSGRGYIWSRTLPMLKDTLILGHGADTYCIYFPHEDYVGKYNAGWNINMIVDKPHNMYFGAAIGTGMISVVALLALFLIYIVQSFRLYIREQYDDFASVTGAGIFFGIVGFLISGFVDDSSVSVMPLFYGLLGVGIAINMMLSAKART